MRFAAALKLVAAGCIAACAAGGQDLPSFVQRLINEYEAAPKNSSPGEIRKYEYNGETVYYVPLSTVCCDRFSVLYDDAGETVCMPDGGITGEGDGKCPDFVARRSQSEQVWRDDRADPGD